MDSKQNPTHQDNHEEDEIIQPANEDDFIYLDEEQLEAMDRDNILPEDEDGEGDDF